MDNGTSWKQGAFMAVFAFLTLLCWCPIGYGSYGPASLMWGMPRWAVIALAIGVVMFLLELIYLFGTDLTLDDDDLPEITRRISSDVR